MIVGACQGGGGGGAYAAPEGRSTFGVATHSQLDRAAVVNWGVAIGKNGRFCERDISVSHLVVCLALENLVAKLLWFRQIVLLK